MGVALIKGEGSNKRHLAQWLALLQFSKEASMNLVVVGISHKQAPVKELTNHITRTRASRRWRARIKNEEMHLFRTRQEQLNVVPTIVSLRRRVEEIRQGEMKRLRHMFGDLSADQEAALDALTHGLVNKILHTPFTELKHAAARPDRSEFIDVVQTIFHLQAISPTRPAPII